MLEFFAAAVLLSLISDSGPSETRRAMEGILRVTRREKSERLRFRVLFLMPTDRWDPGMDFSPDFLDKMVLQLAFMFENEAQVGGWLAEFRYFPLAAVSGDHILMGTEMTLLYAQHPVPASSQLEEHILEEGVAIPFWVLPVRAPGEPAALALSAEERSKVESAGLLGLPLDSLSVPLLQKVEWNRMVSEQDLSS